MHVVKHYVVTYAVFKLYHPPSRSKNDRCSPMCGQRALLGHTKGPLKTARDLPQVQSCHHATFEPPGSKE